MLFTLPKQVPINSAGQPLALAKAYFYRAGTTTPQNVYTTADLSVAHAHPVVADAAGVFPAIYFNTGASYDYRVQVKTSADVLIYDEDDIPKAGLTQTELTSIGILSTGIKYDITTAEISTSVVPSNYKIPTPLYIGSSNIIRFDGDPTGVASSSDAIMEAVDILPSTGGVVKAPPGVYLLGTQVLVNTKTNVILDFRGSKLIAKNGLNDTLINLLSCTACTVLPGYIDGNAAGQTLSSFGVSLNGGNYNKTLGGRITNCKTYGAYTIGCNYGEIGGGIILDNNQQSGLGADVGSSDVVGFKFSSATLFNNGLLGSGATSGAQIEGNDSFGFYYKEAEIGGLVTFGNRGSGITLQNVRGYTLNKIHAFNNYVQGITIASCLDGSGGEFSLDNNDLAGTTGYQNGLAIDDAAVSPASQRNSFVGISSRNHAGFAVIERGSANNNTFLNVTSSSDGGVFSLSGANSIGVNGGIVTGSLLCKSGGVGYTTGAGGTVTQATSKSTGVTLNKPTGTITLNNAALAADTTVTFTLTNSSIVSTDVINMNVISGGTPGAYLLNARAANGSAVIEVRNITGGSLSEAIVILFVVVKGSVS